MDHISDTLGQIAAALPGATQIFRQHKLDFCCSGSRTLAQALEGREDEQAAILKELELLTLNVREQQAPNSLSNHALINRILGYHAKHRGDLCELTALSATVESVHQSHDSCPHGLTKLLAEMQVAMEEHMSTEEERLFPAILQASGRGCGELVREMMDEHTAHGRKLEVLEALMKGYAVPRGACATWKALIAGVRRFTEDLTEHIHLENNILFPRVLAPEAEHVCTCHSN